MSTIVTSQIDTEGLKSHVDRFRAVEDEDLHKMLAELDLELHEAPGAIREYRALVLVKSQDQAAAHFGLAREELLNAFEVAPYFKPAQKMLLEMNASD